MTTLGKVRIISLGTSTVGRSELAPPSPGAEGPQQQRAGRAVVEGFERKASSAPKSWYAEAYKGKVSVPADKQDFAVPFAGYAPPEVFVSKKAGTPYPALQKSYQAYGDAAIKLDPKGRPLHPWGRQGVAGPGAIGSFGPKLAVDPILARMHPEHGLQFLAIKRGDTGVWAFPGGKLDPLPNGQLESPSVAAARELGEEAGIFVDAARFEKAVVVFEGPNGDPRDTDNAWFESQGRLLVMPWDEAKDIVPIVTPEALEAKWLNADVALKVVTHANHQALVAAAIASV